MFWLRGLFVLGIGSLIILFINSKLKNKEIVMFVTAYIITILVTMFTGFSYNIFHDKFDLISLIIDITIWILAYMVARLIISKVNK